jgi:hypothetical protein
MQYASISPTNPIRSKRSWPCMVAHLRGEATYQEAAMPVASFSSTRIFAPRTGPSMAEGKPQYLHALNRTTHSTATSMTWPVQAANVQLIQERWEQKMWDEGLPMMGSVSRMQNARFRKDFGPVWDCLEDMAITFELQPDSHCLDVHYNKLIPQISLPSQRYLLDEKASMVSSENPS